MLADDRLASRGMKLHGASFIVSPDEAAALGLCTVPGLNQYIHPNLNGRDLTQRRRRKTVIDMHGLDEAEIRRRFGAVLQHLKSTISAHRDATADGTANQNNMRNNGGSLGSRGRFYPALKGLTRYIATVETTKHRPFCFLPAAVMPDNMLVCIASDDVFHLGVLSSRLHIAWALAAGGTLEDRPRYNKTRCFDPFPFPDATGAQRASIAAIADELDALRRTRLDANPHLTMTGLYNVLDALRAGRALTEDERPHPRGRPRRHPATPPRRPR